MSEKGNDRGRPPPPPSLSATLMRLAGQTGPAPQPDFDKLRRDMEAESQRHGAVRRTLDEIRARERIDAEVEKCRRDVAADPNSPGSLLRLADALRDQNNLTEAIAIYRRCADIPATAVPARYFLAALGAAPPPAAMPEAMVVSLFDHYADTFEDTLVQTLKYQGPNLLRDAVLAVLGPNPGRYDIMDAGCGTGLCAEPFRPLARRLDGIDIAPKMVELARRKGLYDRLECGELCRTLEGMPDSYDIVIAADVLSYLGPLEPAFRAVAHALRRTGLLAFTIENSDGEDYVLSATGRFAHGATYIEAAADRTGFTVERADPCTLRFEMGKGVAATASVLRRR